MLITGSLNSGTYDFGYEIFYICGRRENNTFLKNKSGVLGQSLYVVDISKPRAIEERATDVLEVGKRLSPYYPEGSGTSERGVDENVFVVRFDPGPGGRQVGRSYVDQESLEYSPYCVLSFRNLSAVKQLNEEWSVSL